MGGMCSTLLTKGNDQGEDWSRPTRRGPDAVGRRADACLASQEGPLEELVKKARPEDVSMISNHQQEQQEEAAEAAELVPEVPWAPTVWTRGDLIGSGAFGRVYLGLNNDNGQLMAVKQVPLARGDQAMAGKVTEHVLGLETEVAVLKSLNHPNIVRYLGTERSDGTLNIFLEYVPGGSIASLLTKFGSFTEPVLKVYTRQILEGVQYLHKNGVMHRDIKGANILVDNTGLVKLADFGASRKIENLATIDSGFKSIKGTPYWMAPEVIRQSGHGRQADIWSIACTVIEMATGKPPWSQCNSQMSALFHIASSKDPPPLPEHLSRECKDFLLLCFNRDPRMRPNADRLLQHPFISKGMPRTPAVPGFGGAEFAQPRSLLAMAPSPIQEEPTAEMEMTALATGERAPSGASPSPHRSSPSAPPSRSAAFAAAPLPPMHARHSRADASMRTVDSDGMLLPDLGATSFNINSVASSVRMSDSFMMNPVEEPSWMASSHMQRGSSGGAPNDGRRGNGGGGHDNDGDGAEACTGSPVSSRFGGYGGGGGDASPEASGSPVVRRGSIGAYYDSSIDNDMSEGMVAAGDASGSVDRRAGSGSAAAGAGGDDEADIRQFLESKASQDLLRLSGPFRSSMQQLRISSGSSGRLGSSPVAVASAGSGGGRGDLPSPSPKPRVQLHDGRSPPQQQHRQGSTQQQQHQASPLRSKRPPSGTVEDLVGKSDMQQQLQQWEAELEEEKEQQKMQMRRQAQCEGA